MRAVIYEKYGPPEVLHVGEREKPVPRDNELLVRVMAAEATKSDCELRRFRFPVRWFWLPMRLFFGVTRPRNQVLGGYFAGRVEEVGGKVTRFEPGDEIFGSAGLTMGAYGEYLCLPESSSLAPRPANLSFEEAAAVPLGGLNALHFLEKAQIRSGEDILIIGAGGSIGTFGVQIAKARGARVTAVDSPVKEEMLRRIGADDFIDYTLTKILENGRTYDVIFNMVAGTSLMGSVGILNPRGRYLTANPRFSHLLLSGLLGRIMKKTVVTAFAGESVGELMALKELIEEEAVKPVLDRVYSMDQAALAHRRVEAEERLGVVVISLDGSSAERIG